MTQTLLSQLDEKTRTELEAQVFRRLIAHLQQRSAVQNIELMNLAGFCRNCLSNWYEEAAAERNLQLERDEVRHEIYGMAYEQWKALHQKEATPEQLQAFAQRK